MPLIIYNHVLYHQVERTYTRPVDVICCGELIRMWACTLKLFCTDPIQSEGVFIAMKQVVVKLFRHLLLRLYSSSRHTLACIKTNGLSFIPVKQCEAGLLRYVTVTAWLSVPSIEQPWDCSSFRRSWKIQNRNWKRVVTRCHKLFWKQAMTDLYKNE